jgi:hypothetical protein
VDKFWSLVKESVIVQGIMTLMLVGTICYLCVAGREVPILLTNLVLIVVGFYFGAKSKVNGREVTTYERQNDNDCNTGIPGEHKGRGRD